MEKDSKTKDLSILFKENYENWFKCIKVKIKGKKAYYSIESNRTKYIWIYRERGAANINRKGKPDMEKVIIIIDIINNSKVDNLINKFERIKGLWNIKNAKK